MKFSWYVASIVAMLAFFILLYPIWILLGKDIYYRDFGWLFPLAALIDIAIASFLSLLLARETKAYALIGMWVLIGIAFALIYYIMASILFTT